MSRFSYSGSRPLLNHTLACKKTMNKRERMLGLMMVLGSLTIAAMPSPKDWRAPQDIETQQDWRNTDKNRFLVALADFDGDGVQDEARLMVRNDGKAQGLIVWSSAFNSTIVLNEDPGHRLFEAMGIAVAKPGKYLTACGKGYFDCGTGDPVEIVLSKPAIDYFKEGSANSFYWWDNQKKAFTRTWISD